MVVGSKNPPPAFVPSVEVNLVKAAAAGEDQIKEQHIKDA